MKHFIKKYYLDRIETLIIRLLLVVGFLFAYLIHFSTAIVSVGISDSFMQVGIIIVLATFYMLCFEFLIGIVYGMCKNTFLMVEKQKFASILRKYQLICLALLSATTAVLYIFPLLTLFVNLVMVMVISLFCYSLAYVELDKKKSFNPLNKKKLTKFLVTFAIVYFSINILQSVLLL